MGSEGISLVLQKSLFLRTNRFSLPPNVFRLRDCVFAFAFGFALLLEDC